MQELELKSTIQVCQMEELTVLAPLSDSTMV